MSVSAAIAGPLFLRMTRERDRQDVRDRQRQGSHVTRASLLAHHFAIS